MLNRLFSRLLLLFSNKTSLSLFVLGLFIIGETCIYYVAKNRYDSDFTSYSNHAEANWQEDYSSIVNSYQIIASILAQNIADETALLDALHMSNDKNETDKAHALILSQFSSFYNANQEISLGVFQIHNAKGDVLARLQKPSSFGDNVLGFRKLIRDVHEKHKSTYGYEPGIHFNAYRYVFPVIGSGKFLGSVELGIKESQINKSLKRDFGIGAYLALEPAPKISSDKNFIKTDSFLGGKLYHNASIYQGKELELLQKIFNVKPRGFDEAIFNRQKVIFSTEVGGEDYLVVVKPFFGYADKFIGYLTLYHKDTTVLAMKKEFYQFILLASIALVLWLASMYAIRATMRASELEEQKDEALRVNETLVKQAREIEEASAELDASYEEARRTNEMLLLKTSELELSEERFRQIFENMSSGVAVYEAVDDGADFVFKNFNASAEKIENLSREQVVNRRLTEMYPNIEEFGFLQALREVHKNGGSKYFPISFYKDTRIAGWRENFICKLSTGEIVAIYDDVTERKRAEEALKESENRLKTIIDMEPECVKIMSEDGLLAYMNPAGLEMIEADSFEQVNGAVVTEIIAPEYRMAYAKLHKRVIAGERMTMQYEVLGLKGGRRWLETHAVPMRVEDKIMHLAVTRDISERKKMEEALRYGEEKLKLAVRSGGVGIWELDLVTNALIWDDAMFAIYGATLDEFSGAYDAWASRVHKDDIEYAAKALRDGADGIKPYNVEFRVVHLDGSVHFVKADAIVLRDDDGKALRMIGTNWDITKSKEAEGLLKSFNEELEKKVEEETAKRLEKEKLLIQQSKMAMMGEMIGAIAHQWRQPLNSLGISIQDAYLAYKLEELNAEYMEEFKTTSMSMIQRMSNTIDDFRNFFRPNKEKEEFIVERAVANALSIMLSQLKNHSINVEFNPSSETKAYGYKSELEQAILIIISNAKDALIDNNIQNPKIEITINTDTNTNKVSLSIKDNGGGVPVEIMDRIFEPYFTTKEQGKGTGIGLYMTKEIIERQMGGKIYCENTDDGAKFVVEMGGLL